MNDQDQHSPESAGKQGATGKNRKPYKSPQLQVFGRLSRLTHGSIGNNNDADAGKGNDQVKGGGK